MRSLLTSAHAGSRRRVLGTAAALALPALVAWPLLKPHAAQATQAVPRRLVSIGGALTETVYALGAHGELVGVDTTSLFPAAAQQLPSVGYARALSAEGLLSLRPTLVLAGPEAGPPAVLRQLESARVTVVQLDAGHSAEGGVARTARLGELIGRAAEGRALAAQQQAAWERAREQVAALAAGKPMPRVLFVLSHSMAQLRIAGQGTAAHAVIGLAGGRNALAELDGFKPLTPESAIAAAPEVILATEQGLAAAGGIDGLLQAPGLAATPAGRARRVVALEALYLLGFGPRQAQAVVQLAQMLHGGRRQA
jgi:iron complex transport system substrate-binding protein